jgi:uncharacterized protein (DUF433 family)
MVWYRCRVWLLIGRQARTIVVNSRLWVTLILDFLADGMSEAHLLSDYPQLSHADVMAAIAYGAEMSRERILPVPLRHVA